MNSLSTFLSRQPRSSLAAAAVLVLGLSACGGGSSNDSADTPTSDPSAVAGTCNLLNFQQELMTRINALRAAGADCGTSGVFPATTAMTWNAQLTQAADGHAKDMAAKNYFSHTSQDGRTMSDRVNATGYAWSSLGENIAAGQPTVESVMDSWRNSPGHCANLMSASYTNVGVSCQLATAQGATYSKYWVMNLGKPR
ncbi:CAP domain-containing protein [Roseateles amylovorans]|uniref:CAP domain-containing protein n=1 Tax=Roseateles amylovorans TaxID=2978473 RepID=A0ABY6B1R1_9BURK|nr:CAP domain-containing protein [Roseateles amylovorans]UXH79153.1 CAP domain-containing protein [Roseateles amylovorans]